MGEERPIGEENAGVDFGEVVPDGMMALSYSVQLKCLDEDGHVTLLHIRSPDLTVWEALGMTMSAAQFYERVMAGTDG